MFNRDLTDYLLKLASEVEESGTSVSEAKASLERASDFLDEMEDAESSDEVADDIDEVVGHWMKEDALKAIDSFDLDVFYDADGIVDLVFEKVSDPSVVLEVLDTLLDDEVIQTSDLKHHHEAGNVSQVFADLKVEDREPARAKYDWLRGFID